MAVLSGDGSSTCTCWNACRRSILLNTEHPAKRSLNVVRRRERISVEFCHGVQSPKIPAYPPRTIWFHHSMYRWCPIRVASLNDLFCFPLSELFFHLHLLFAVEFPARRVYWWTVRSNVERCSHCGYLAETRFCYLSKLSPQLGIVIVFVICFTIQDSRITWVHRGNNREHRR